jgi:hypothetical protein
MRTIKKSMKGMIIPPKTPTLTEEEVFIGLVDHGIFADKVPPCFSSVGLTDLLCTPLLKMLETKDEKQLKAAIDKRSHDYVRYAALRDTNIPRHLGIPYPESQIVLALAIKKHWTKIQAHCRRPKQQISRIHVRPVGGGRIFEMNYKGSERFEFEEQELDWMAGSQYLVKADISTCFPSIYTHSIPWALHGIKKSKPTRGICELPGNLLDKCAQITRDQQTNGILIGPISSNIIAEVILTKIDAELLKKGYSRLKRHIDDYAFYAASHEEAEKFILELGLALRTFELSLNEKKTKILALPRPSLENWIRELNRFHFPQDEDVRYSAIRAFLDLALELAHHTGASTPLNYAIKMIPDRLSERAKRLLTKEAINLALFYPYLAPLLDAHVFSKHPHAGIEDLIERFCNDLIQIGMQKLYPDAIAYSLYYALKYNRHIELTADGFKRILSLNDCLVTVLLLEYATKVPLPNIVKAINKVSLNLKRLDQRSQDRQWLLIYQTWSEASLNGCGHLFLGHLKKNKFKFLTLP